MTPEILLSEPLARRIIEKAIDRLDRVSATDRTNAVRIALDATIAPEIFEPATLGDRDLAWHLLRQLEEEDFGRVEFARAIRHGSPHERRPSFVFSLEAEDRVRDIIGRPRLGPSYSMLWEDLVDASDLGAGGKAVLRKMPVGIAGRTATEVWSALLDLRQHHTENSQLLLREVSAKTFWGLSKVLDGRKELVAAVLDLDECPYPDQPIHLNVYFAGPYAGRLLFIENKASFERAMRDIQQLPRGKTLYEGMAVVYSSGFVGAAKTLRVPGGATVFCAVDEVSSADCVGLFRHDLYSRPEVPTYFWGDLDYSGLAILARLRETFPSAIAWEPGYAPMLRHLLDGGGHAPAEAGKAGQRSILATGCSYSDQLLLPAIEETGRFVDQEGIRVEPRAGSTFMGQSA